MGQIRFYSRMSLADGNRLFAALEPAFEEEGWPLAMTDIDEAADIHEVSVYAEAADHEGVFRQLESEWQRLGLTQPIQTEILPDIDWVAKSLEGLKPVRAGRFLVHGSHDRAERRIGDLSIEIEAGLAFGTGHHGTTAGCLEIIDRVVRQERPRNALDLGAGSAVLAIGVAKLARIPVLATDTDPVATKVAAENARLNGVAQLVDCRTATGFHHRSFGAYAPFDLIVANILAKPLMRLAPQMARHLAPGGSIILSGILERQRNAVLSAYVGQRFRHVATLHRGEWVAMHLKR